MDSTSSINSGLRIGHLNVFHLKNKIPDICALLHTSQPVHLLGLSETRIEQQQNIPDTYIEIPNYTIQRRDSKLKGETGLAIYIHNSIAPIARRRKDLETQNVECLWIEICDPKSKSLLVGIVYRNGSSTYTWYDDFVDMMDAVSGNIKSNVLLLGDFNLDLFKCQPSWTSITSFLGLNQLVTHPTRVTNSTHTLIDHIYTNHPQLVSDVVVLSTSISDHFPIFCTWSMKLSKPPTKGHTTTTYRNFKHFNFDAFYHDLNIAPFTAVCKVNDSDQALTLWYQILLSIFNKHAPIKSKRIKHPKLPPWLTSDIMQAMGVRDRLKKTGQIPEFKKQRNKVKHLVRTAKKKYFEKLVGREKNTSTIWNAVHKIMNTSRHKKNNKESNVYDPNTFNLHFLSIAERLLETKGKQSEIFTSSTILKEFCTNNIKSNDIFILPPITTYEVGKYIKEMSVTTSMGLDGISPFLLKLALPYIVKSLTYIYNLSIKQNKFPSLLKKAKVKPIPKSKELNDLQNYRPISIISIIAKPLEKHIHKHMYQYLIDNNLFSNSQSGFRSKHSCHTALVKMCDEWLTAINRSNIVGTLFLDLKKAFDLVSHNLIIQKLSLYFPGSNLLTLLTSYLTNRTQKVHLNGEYSADGVVYYGVPQGSVLGPLLFCLFINDLPLHITDKTVHCEMFADDTTIYTSHNNTQIIKTKLQHSLNEVHKWCQDNGMILHSDKTKSMVLSTRQKHQIKPLKLDFVLEGNTLEQVHTYRHLGVTIDDELTWHPHISSLCKIISRNLYLLSQLKHFVDIHSLKLFYHAHISSHLTYASTLWDNCSNNVFKLLNSLHRRAAKLMIPDSSCTTNDKLIKLQLLPLKHRLFLNKAVFMFKIINNLTPEYLKSLFFLQTYRHSSRTLILPKTRIDLYKSSLSFSGAVLWNSLPISIRSCKTLKTFRSAVVQHLSKPNTVL